MKNSEECDAAATGESGGVGAEGMLHLASNRHDWVNYSVWKEEK